MYSVSSQYIETCLKWPLNNKQNKGLKAMWNLNAGQKYCRMLHNTLKPVLSGHPKTNKTKVLKPCGTLMQVKNTAECSTGPALSNYLSRKPFFLSFEWPLKTGFTVCSITFLSLV